MRRFTRCDLQKPLLKTALLATALVLSIPLPSQAVVNLGSYDVKPNEVSTSGVSSGAYFAEQFAVAFSSKVVGVGIIAGGPYYCGQNNTATAYQSCMVGFGGYPTAGPLITKTNEFAAAGSIDPTSNLAKQKVYLFNSYNDGEVHNVVSAVAISHRLNYESAGNIFFRDNLRGVHTMPTDNSLNGDCNVFGSPYLANCNYDAAGKILEFVYGRLNPRNTGTLTGSFVEFNQSEFGNMGSISMDNTGWAYVPAACSASPKGKCRVHIAFHGCHQGISEIGDKFYKQSGYNNWADTNNLIILYPQAKASSSFPTNPNGCWDWWGYNDSDYAKKNGLQMAAVKRMLDRLTAGYTNWTITPPGSFGAPTNVSTIDASGSRVMLRWSAVNSATGYNVYRSTSSTGTFTLVNGATTVKGQSYSDSGLAANTTYFYRVRAVNTSNVESADSATVSKATGSVRPNCTIYTRPSSVHVNELRATANFIGQVWANGSIDYVGLYADLTPKHLRKDGTNYYRANVLCP